ncbi:MAG: hypothetical protein R2862_06345 [Thermoanaerobaculia bacterium]
MDLILVGLADNLSGIAFPFARPGFLEVNDEYPNGSHYVWVEKLAKDTCFFGR